MTHPRAQVVPFSSVVGSGITLHDPETGKMIGQLAILNTGGDTPEDRKQRQIAFAEDTAKRINAHNDLVDALRPFADAAEHVPLEEEDTKVIAHVPAGPHGEAFKRMGRYLTAANFRAAVAALRGAK